MNTPEERAALQQDLHATLDKASKHFNIFRVLRTISYGFTLLYLIFIIAVLFFGSSMNFFSNDYSINPHPTFWEQNRILIYILPLFIGIFISSNLFPYFYRKYQEADQASVQRIMKTLFPDARVTIGACTIREETVMRSKLFDLANRETFIAPYSYGCIKFNDETTMRVDDLTVPMTKGDNWLMSWGLGQYLFLFKSLYTGIFTSKVDVVGQFRGLFIQTKIDMSIPLDLILLPDKSEARLESIATMIQSLSKREGLHFVHLEDVAFEKRFKVYTSDDINARYLLTPIMMERIVALYESFGGRDLFMSFCGDTLSVAVSVPEGIFSAVRSSVDPKLIDNLYDSIMGFRNIPQHLQLKN